MEYKVSLQNPWFDLINSGLKKYEGRLNWKIWNDLKIGDHIIFKNNKNRLNVVVIEIKKYSNFIAAYDDLGEYLIPLSKINRDNLMSEVYSKYYSNDDILKHGVIAIGIKLVM